MLGDVYGAVKSGKSNVDYLADRSGIGGLKVADLIQQNPAQK